VVELKNNEDMNTVIISVPDSGDLKNIAVAVRQLKGVDKIKVHRDATSERIPGLAYTHEERMECIRRAEENIRAGNVYSAEEVRAMFPRP
jgi:ribosome recycling factor